MIAPHETAPVEPIQPPAPGARAPTEQQWGLILRYLPLAERTARIMARERPDRLEEFRDAAVDGLIECCCKDLSGVANIGGFVANFARERIIDRIRRLSALKRGGGSAHRRLTPDMPCPGRARDDSPSFDELVAPLDFAERQVLAWRYLEGLRPPEIGVRISRSVKTVERIEARAKDKIARRLSRD